MAEQFHLSSLLHMHVRLKLFLPSLILIIIIVVYLETRLHIVQSLEGTE